MSSHDQSIAPQEHALHGSLMDPVSESPIQRTASPPPLQLSASPESETSESEGLGSFDLGSAAKSGTLGAGQPPNSGATMQRQTDEASWNTPVPGSFWAGKTARVSVDGYQVWQSRDRDGTPTPLPFNTQVSVLNEYPQSWLEIVTTTGVYGYVGIPEQNMELCPEADPMADLYRVQGGESAYTIAQAHYGSFARFGADLRYFIALIARLNNIDIGNDIDSWKDTQLNAGQTIFLPTMVYAGAMEGIVNSGSYTAEGLKFIEDLGAATRRIMDDISTSVEIAGSIIAEGWLGAIVDGFVGATEDKINELTRRLKIVAATTAAGALIAAALTGGAGTLAGAQLGMQLGNSIVNGIELFEGAVGILELAAFFVGELVNYLSLILNPEGLEDNAEQAGTVLGNATLRLITEVTSEIVGDAMSPGGGDGRDGRTDGNDSGGNRRDGRTNGRDGNNNNTPNYDIDPDNNRRPNTDPTRNNNPENGYDPVGDQETLRIIVTGESTDGDSGGTPTFDVDPALSNRASSLGFELGPNNPVWRVLTQNHLDKFEALPDHHKHIVNNFIRDDNDYSTPESRVSILDKVDDWDALVALAANRNVNHHALMLAMTNPGIRNIEALGNLLNKFTIDEILQNWSVFPGAVPGGTDPYGTGTPTADSVPGDPVNTLDPGTLPAVDRSTLSEHKLRAYDYFTGQGLTARQDGGSLAFFTQDGALVARVDAGRTVYPYNGYGGDVVARSDRTTTLVGRFRDFIDGGGTGFFINRNSSTSGENPGGINVLNDPNWTLDLNIRWLVDAVNRGDEIRLISDPSHIPNYFGGDGNLSVTAHEIGILIDMGVLDASVLPPGLPFNAQQLIPPGYSR